MSQKDIICRRLLFWGLTAVIIFPPLFLGCVDDWCIFVFELLVVFLWGIYLLIDKKKNIEEKLEPAFKSALSLFLVFCGFLLFQIVPLPAFLVKFINPQAFNFKIQFSYEILQPEWMTLSVAPFQTFREALEIVGYGLLAFLIINFVSKPKQVQKLFVVIIGTGFFEAFYGIIQLYGSNPYLLFYRKTINLDYATGTFVNQNHFSGYLEMVLPLAIGFLLYRVNSMFRPGKSWKEKILQLMGKELFLNFLIILSIMVISLGIILSRSRSGTFLLLMTFFLFLGSTFLMAKKTTFESKRLRLILHVLFILVILIFIYSGIGQTLERFSLEKLSQEGRFQFWQNMTEIIKDFPLFGTGLGTFAFVYPAYETGKTYGVLLHAHNDYLEYLSEMGIIGMGLLFGMILIIFTRTVFLWLKRKDPGMKSLILGGLIAVFAMGFHSLTDFNLRIPANSILFTVILSLTFVLSGMKSRVLKNHERK